MYLGTQLYIKMLPTSIIYVKVWNYNTTEIDVSPLNIRNKQKSEFTVYT